MWEFHKGSPRWCGLNQLLKHGNWTTSSQDLKPRSRQLLKQIISRATTEISDNTLIYVTWKQEPACTILLVTVSQCLAVTQCQHVEGTPILLSELNGSRFSFLQQAERRSTETTRLDSALSVSIETCTSGREKCSVATIQGEKMEIKSILVCQEIISIIWNVFIVLEWRTDTNKIDQCLLYWSNLRAQWHLGIREMGMRKKETEQR